MTDYHIRRVDELERKRAALVAQLRSIKRALSEAEFTKERLGEHATHKVEEERLALEDKIHKVEEEVDAATQAMHRHQDLVARQRQLALELMERARAKGHSSLLDDLVAPLASLLVLRWAAFMEAEQEAIALVNETRFSPLLPTDLRQPAWGDPGELNARIIGALEGLEPRSDVSLLKYLGTVAPSVRESARRDPDLLHLLVSWVAGFRFETADGRDDAAAGFDELLARVVEAQGKFGGEFTTPQSVVDLMIQLVDPRPGDRVYDPCFGVGGLLVASAHRVRTAATIDSAKQRHDVRSNGIFGVEINTTAFAIGLCRVVLAGIEQPGLELGDALECPLPRNRAVEGFDCIVAVPPWGRRVADTTARQYPVPSGGIENLFLQHVMANLRPGGRAVIALPERMLFRTGPDRQVRKTLLSEFRVDDVVSLPEGAFAPSTSVPMNLVVFRREPPGADVRFVRIAPTAWGRTPGTDLKDYYDSVRRILLNAQTDEWSSLGDWLGTHQQRDGWSASLGDWLARRQRGGWRTFKDARAFVHGLKLKRQEEWKAYAMSGKRPHDIPASPNDIYGDDGWVSWDDWLGTQRQRGGWRPFKDARAFVHGLKLKTRSEWAAYAKSGKKPRDIPSNPNVIYANDGWVSWGDWLDTGHSPPRADIGGVDVWDIPTKSLASRDYELLAKRSGADLLEATLDRLRAADPKLQIVPLRYIANVASGESYERKLKTEQRNEDVLAPLVRVGDVVDSHVRRPTLFLTKDAAQRVREKHRLHRGDLLLTTSGTVGKVGLVDESLEGAIATKSLAIIRPHQEHPLNWYGIVTSEFLAAILRAPEYQDWFLGHARGATIQHLSVTTLGKIPIPVAPLPVQTAVLQNFSKGTDALALLVRYITGGASDPITAWLERPGVVSLLTEKAAPVDPATSLSAAGKQLLELRPIRNKVVHSVDWSTWRWSDLMSGSGRELRSNIGTSPSPAVLRWLIQAAEMAAVLNDIDTVPIGAPRLAALELAKTRLDAAHSVLADDESPIAARLQAVTSALSRLAQQATASMLATVSITVRVEPNEVAGGVPTEVRLHVRNDSTAGVRRVRISTRPDVGSGDIAYLAESASVAVPLTINANTSAEPLTIGVSWSGYRLDGTLAHGEEGVSILVRSTRETVRAGELGASPYIVGNPIDREEMFFGRSDVIDQIRRQLMATTNANVVLLEGNRRTGKTSILKQLQKKGTLPGWLIVYCNFQEADGDPTRAGISTRDVYRFLARTIGWTLFGAGIRTWFAGQPPFEGKRGFPTEFLAARDRAITDEHPFEAFELYLSAAIEAVRPQRLLLMLDEFDKLQDGIDSGVTSPQVPENIRHILQHHQGLSAILTGSRRLKRLREEYWSALFGLGYRVGISSLPIGDAQRLVTEPVAGRLNYLSQARDRVVALCAAQPFLIQSLCNRIFERAASSGELAITVGAVEAAAVEMVRDNEHFRTLWDYAQTHRRRLLLALCERFAEGADAVTLDFLSSRIEAAGVPVPRQTLLGDDLEYLRELELVEFDKGYRGGTYRIAVPLLGRWIRTSIDFDDTVARAKEEALEAHQ